MLSSGHPLATEAGLRTLRNGGNAFDAVVTAAAVIAVAEPGTNHVGGDVFALCLPAGAADPVHQRQRPCARGPHDRRI